MLVMKRPQTGRTIAKNLEFLQDRSGIEWQAISERSGVSLRTISYIRKNPERSPTIESVDALAQVFGLTGWHLLNPNLLAEIENSAWLERIRSAFTLANPQGQALLQKATEAVEMMQDQRPVRQGGGK
jgi:transcriptional regulator with XRE-family HTH domain